MAVGESGGGRWRRKRRMEREGRSVSWWCVRGIGVGGRSHEGGK